MQLEFTEDVEAYADATTAFLERDPVLCTVALTTIVSVRSRVREGPFVGSWVVDDAGDVCGAAAWTPPYELVVTSMPAAAIDTVAAGWAARVEKLGGLVGPRPVAERCARAFAEHTGRRAEEQIAERLFRLDAVVDPPRPPGDARAATPGDATVGVEWMDAFAREAGVPPVTNATADVAARIDSGRLHFWVVDAEPVSLVGHSVSVAGVTRVGPVYTPEQHRGRGYARALVADVSRQRLAAGDTACCLFTDLANPVSNAIYQQVGYQPVADFAVIHLKG